MDRFALFMAMVNGTEVRLATQVGRIQSIEMEDGSGFLFNVRLARKDGTEVTVFVRTKLK